MKCTHIKSNGLPCNAYAVNDSEYCFTHNPELKEAKALAVTKGGLNRKYYKVYGKPIKISTPQDVKRFLGRVINGVWTGEIPCNSPANTFGFLSRCFLDAHEQAELENRVKTLERLVKDQRL